MIFECRYLCVFFVYADLVRISNVQLRSMECNWQSSRRGHCDQEIPSHFVQRHADSIREFTSIQLGGAGREKCQQWEIRLRVYWESGTSYRVKISSDGVWRSFMASSGLQMRDWLIFVLTGMSTFDVYMFDNRGNSRVTYSQHQTHNIGNISSSISGEGSQSEIFNARDVQVPPPLREQDLTENLMSRVKHFRCILEGSTDRAVLVSMTHLCLLLILSHKFHCRFVAIFLLIFGAHVYILHTIKVDILFLLQWS